MNDVLVEVYDHPEVAVSDHPDSTLQRRISACVTSNTGQFSINVPSGFYEVRFSSSSPLGVECTSILVKVRRFSTRSRFRVRMGLSY
jgi:hypothetical protein